MSAESDFEEARRRIAEAKEKSFYHLDLSELKDLSELPPEIADLVLSTLYLDNTQVSDISPLAGMTGMTTLNLSYTQVSDISPLAGMTGMTVLTLSNTQVSDIAPLAGMTGMTTLNLSTTQVSDISPLAGMTAMTTLSLSYTQVSDISPLAGMTGMETLTLSTTQVSDISPLVGMAGMRALTLYYTQVSDISALAGMTGMTRLDLDQTQVSDISPLAGMSGMKMLDLTNTQVSDISTLAGIMRMETLYLGNTQVTDISPLARMTGMDTLTLNDTQVSDISPLAGMTGMKWLDLANTQISDLRVLLRCPRLESPEGEIDEIRFAGCFATILDPQLADIAEIEDRATRAKRLFERLREIGDNWPPVPQMAPDQQGAPRIDLVDGQIDLVHSRPDASEQSDPVKQKALERLREAVVHMCRVGNRYPDLDTCSRRLARLIEPDLAEIDLLEVHFELEFIRGTYDRRDEREGEDRLDAEAVGALDRVGMVGPGLTLDNEDVERLEERRRRYREDPPSGEIRETQDDLSQSIADTPQLFGEDLRELSARLAAMEAKSDRLLAGQNDGNRNVIIVAGIAVADKLLWGMAGGPLSGVGNAAFDWLVANADTILILADHWGEAFRAWITPILMRAREATSAAAKLTKRH